MQQQRRDAKEGGGGGGGCYLESGVDFQEDGGVCTALGFQVNEELCCSVRRYAVVGGGHIDGAHGAVAAEVTDCEQRGGIAALADGGLHLRQHLYRTAPVKPTNLCSEV